MWKLWQLEKYKKILMWWEIFFRMVISCISRIPYLALKKLEKTCGLYSGFYGNCFSCIISTHNCFSCIISTHNCFSCILSTHNCFSCIISTHNCFSCIISTHNCFSCVITTHKAIVNNMFVSCNRFYKKILNRPAGFFFFLRNCKVFPSLYPL